MDFSNDKSMRHRMDEIKKTVSRAAASAKGNGSKRQCKQESES